MIRTGLLTLAMMMFPATAVAHCGASSASFAVTCENGVKVYRHKAPSLRMHHFKAPQQSSTIEARRLAIAEERLALERQAQADRAEERRQDARAEDYRQRVIAQRRIDRVRGYGPAPGLGFGLGFSGGYTLARPVRVRASH